jgi:hypothetical protein
MPLTRRDLLGLSLTSTISALITPRLVSANTPVALYENSIIIDGLGFPGGLSIDESSPLNTLELEHVSQSGLTAAHLTVGVVGTMPPLQAFKKMSGTSPGGTGKSKKTRIRCPVSGAPVTYERLNLRETPG